MKDVMVALKMELGEDISTDAQSLEVTYNSLESMLNIREGQVLTSKS